MVPGLSVMEEEKGGDGAAVVHVSPKWNK